MRHAELEFLKPHIYDSGDGFRHRRPRDGGEDPWVPSRPVPPPPPGPPPGSSTRGFGPHTPTVLPYEPPPESTVPIITDLPDVPEGSGGGDNLQNLPNQPPQTPRNLTTNALGATIPVTYGQTQKGAEIIFQPVVVGQNLVVAFSLGEGPIEGVLSITIDGRDLGTAVNAGQAGLGLTAGAQYNIYTGTPSQTVDPLLAAANPLHVTGWPGLAYIAISFPQPTQATGNYDPMRFVAEIKGIKCINPRVDLVTRTYTDNPILHIFDLMTTPTYGLGVSFANMDAPSGSSTSSWAVAATDCEFALARTAQPGAAPTLGSNTAGGSLSNATYTWTISYTGASGVESIESAASTPTTIGQNTQQVVNWVVGPAGTTTIKLYRNRSGALTTPRYLVQTFNNNTTVTYTDGIADGALGTVSGTQSIRFAEGLCLRDTLAASDVFNTMRAHCMAYMSYNAGLYQIFIDKAKSASGIVFTDSGASANIQGLPTIRSKGVSEVFTKVVVEYLDAGNGYISQTAEAELPTVATRVDERRELRLSLLGVRTFDQAQRLAIMNLNRSAADKEITFVATAEGVQPLPGDVVTVTSSIGLSSVLVIVSDCQPDHVGMIWTIKGEFYDAAIYSDTVVANPISLAPPKSPFAPAAVTGASFVTHQGPEVFTPPPPGSTTSGTYTSTSYAGAIWTIPQNLGVSQYRVRVMADPSSAVRDAATWASIGIAGEWIVPYGGPALPGGQPPTQVRFASTIAIGSVSTSFWQNGNIRFQNIAGNSCARVIVRAESADGVQSADTILDGPGIFSSTGTVQPSFNYTISTAKSVAPPTFRDVSMKVTIQQSSGSTHNALYRFTATALGYVIATGDALEFDIFCDGTSTHFKSGVYIRFTDGTLTEGANALPDANALNANNGDKTLYAKECWYHVQAPFLAGHVGKTIDHVGLSDSNGTTAASLTVTYLRNIVVTNLEAFVFGLYQAGHVVSQATFRDTTVSILGAIARASYHSDLHSDDITSFGLTIYASGTTTVLGQWDNASLRAAQIGVNTTALIAGFGIDQTYEGAGTRGINIGQHTTDASASYLWFRKSRGTKASPTAVASSDVLGQILFNGYDGTVYRSPAAIKVIADAAPVNNTSLSSALQFFTGTVGAAGGAERLRITGTGDTLFMPVTSGSGSGFKAQATGSTGIAWALPNADGTNGQVLITNGSAVLSWASTGGGNSTSTGTEAARPAAGTAGNVYFPNNGSRISRDNATTYDSWGPIFPLTDVMPAFAWRNQGTASVNTTYGVEELVIPAVNGYSFRGREIAVPTAPYAIEISLLTLCPVSTATTMGLYISDGTKLITFGYPFQAAAPVFLGSEWTNATTPAGVTLFNPGVLQTCTGWVFAGPAFIRFRDDNTTWFYELSFDGGAHYSVLFSHPRNTFLTPTKIGYGGYLNTATASLTAYGRLIHWKQT